MKHFRDINDLTKDELDKIIDYTFRQKKLISDKKFSKITQILKNKSIGLYFEKPSTRTRVSFEVSVNQLGGNCIQLKPEELQISRGETISDTAKVLSRYLDGIVIRCFSHSLMLDFANNASIPVINGLTDSSHPCQVIADLFTIKEHFGKLEDQKIAWLGDGNNVAKSWVDIAKKTNIELIISTPSELSISETIIKDAITAGANIKYEEDPYKAVESANVITTDTWISMGDDSSDKDNLLKRYQVNNNLIKEASKDVIFMHCLPATRGKEVSEEVIDGNKSIVLDQSENRLHVQRTILNWCFEDELN